MKNYFTLTKIICAVALLFTTLTNNAQCNASFTSTNGVAGLVNFNSTSTGTINPTWYVWTFGDGGTGAGANPSHTYSVNGTYNIALAIYSGSPALCTDSAWASVVITNTAVAPCSPSVYFAMQKDSLALPAIVWDALPTYPAGTVTANWIWGDGSNTIGLYPSHTYSAAGYYTVCVNATVACVGGGTSTTGYCYGYNIYRSAQSNAIAQINVVHNFPTAIKNISKENVALTLYPNPNNGEFNLEMSSDMSVKFLEVSIVNLMGQVVYTSKDETTANTFSKKINVSNIANGTYFMKTNTGNSVTTKKLVINK